MFKVHVYGKEKPITWYLFQNISCLRFIRVIGGVYGKNFTISKHFMFKVHETFAILVDEIELFQNISCLRFIF